MALDWKKLTRHAQKAIVEGQDLAASLGSSVVQPEHLLTALIDDPGASGLLLLQLSGVSLEDVRGLLEDRLSDYTGTGAEDRKPTMGQEVREIVEVATIQAGTGSVSTDHLVIALLESHTPLSAALREECGVEVAEVAPHMLVLSEHELRGPTAGGKTTARPPVAPNRPAPAPPVAPPAPPPNRPPHIQPEAGSSTTDSTTHTVLALARLVVDLAGKAARTASEHGNPALAAQLEMMRAEVEGQIKKARPVSVLGAESRKERSA